MRWVLEAILLIITMPSANAPVNIKPMAASDLIRV